MRLSRRAFVVSTIGTLQGMSILTIVGCGPPTQTQAKQLQTFVVIAELAGGLLLAAPVPLGAQIVGGALLVTGASVQLYLIWSIDGGEQRTRQDLHDAQAAEALVSEVEMNGKLKIYTAVAEDEAA